MKGSMLALFWSFVWLFLALLRYTQENETMFLFDLGVSLFFTGVVFICKAIEENV